MRTLTTATTTLLVAGLASLAYAAQPALNRAHDSGALMAGYSVASTAAQEEAKPKPMPEPKAPRAERQEQPARQDKATKSEQKKESKADKKQDKNQAKADRKADKNGEGKHGRVPEKTYKAHFGQQHKVTAKRIVTTTHIVPNQTRFTYVGYTFVFVQPWPMGWGFDDDVYIDYVDGGWFMFDAMHPGVQLGLSIVM